MYAWHFLKTPNTLRDGSTFNVGQWLPEIADPVLCVRGYHGSRRAIDALQYAPGPIVTWCEYDGAIIHESDKLVAVRRRPIWQYDATAVLHEFACLCAEDALTLVANPDSRLAAAIAAKRAWIRGEITDRQLDAAELAAWAVRDHLLNTAAVAAGAALSAEAVARSAAQSVLGSTLAVSVARVARAAVLAETRNAQNTRLEAMLNAGRPK
jgi:hypothetical protein